jgi:hypothetical protein
MRLSGKNTVVLLHFLEICLDVSSFTQIQMEEDKIVFLAHTSFLIGDVQLTIQSDSKHENYWQGEVRTDEMLQQIKKNSHFVTIDTKPSFIVNGVKINSFPRDMYQRMCLQHPLFNFPVPKSQIAACGLYMCLGNGFIESFVENEYLYLITTSSSGEIKTKLRMPFNSHQKSSGMTLVSKLLRISIPIFDMANKIHVAFFKEGLKLGFEDDSRSLWIQLYDYPHHPSKSSSVILSGTDSTQLV